MIMILQIVVGLLLSLAILIQQRASGLSATFGGMGGAYVQRRGAEALLFQATIWLAIIFFALGALQIFV